MSRLLLRIAATILIGLFVLVAADQIVWLIRNAHHTGTSEIVVTQVSAAALKNKHEEYYFDGDISITCARSLLPPLTSGGWLPPCWYIRMHPTVVTHI